MKDNKEPVNIVAGVDNIKGIPTEEWTSKENFLRSTEGLLVYDKRENIIGEIGEVVIIDGVVKGVKIKLYDV